MNLSTRFPRYLRKYVEESVTIGAAVPENKYYEYSASTGTYALTTDTIFSGSKTYYTLISNGFHKAEHKSEFLQRLRDFQVNNIADKATSMKRQLRNYPQWTIPRTLTLPATPNPITIKRNASRGTVTDSIWKETVGSYPTIDSGITFDFNRDIARAMISLPSWIADVYPELGKVKELAAEQDMTGFLSTNSTIKETADTYNSLVEVYKAILRKTNTPTYTYGTFDTANGVYTLSDLFDATVAIITHRNTYGYEVNWNKTIEHPEDYIKAELHVPEKIEYTLGGSLPEYNHLIDSDGNDILVDGSPVVCTEHYREIDSIKASLNEMIASLNNNYGVDKETDTAHLGILHSIYDAVGGGITPARYTAINTYVPTDNEVVTYDDAGYHFTANNVKSTTRTDDTYTLADLWSVVDYRGAIYVIENWKKYLDSWDWYNAYSRLIAASSGSKKTAYINSRTYVQVSLNLSNKLLAYAHRAALVIVDLSQHLSGMYYIDKRESKGEI